MYTRHALIWINDMWKAIYYYTVIGIDNFIEISLYECKAKIIYGKSEYK